MKTKLILGLMLFFGLFANANEIKKDKEELKNEEDIYTFCATRSASALNSDGQKVTVTVTVCAEHWNRRTAEINAVNGAYELALKKANYIASWESTF